MNGNSAAFPTYRVDNHNREDTMAKGQRRSSRESKKPKQQKPKTIAAAASTKPGWQPSNAPSNKK
jgi:hypothetical protein